MQLDHWTEAHEEAEAARARAQQAAMTGDGWTVVVRAKVCAAFPSHQYFTHIHL